MSRLVNWHNNTFPNWYEIPPHELLLRGYHDAYISMTVKRYLADERDSSPAALGMDVEIGNPVPIREPLAFHSGYYGWLSDVRQELSTLRRAGTGCVRFDGAEYFGWSIEPLENGSGDELVFEMAATTFIYEQPNWPENLSLSLKRNCDHLSGACVQYTFVTSRIAESWLEDFIRQMDELNDLLGLW